MEDYEIQLAKEAGLTPCGYDMVEEAQMFLGTELDKSFDDVVDQIPF